MISSGRVNSHTRGVPPSHRVGNFHARDIGRVFRVAEAAWSVSMTASSECNLLL